MDSSNLWAYDSQSCSWNSFILRKLSLGTDGDLSFDFECLFWMRCVMASIELFINSSKSITLFWNCWWLFTRWLLPSKGFYPITFTTASLPSSILL